jgi:ABC-2 type transport system permease protein
MSTFDGIRLTARRELVERTRRDRSFLISTLVTLAILFAIIFLPRLFGANEPQEFDVGLVGPASAPLGEVLTAQGQALDVQIRVRRPATAAEAEAAVRDGTLDLAVIDGRELVAKEEADEQLNVLVQSASRIVRAQQTLEGAGVAQGEIQSALAPPPLPVRSLDPVDENARSKRTIATVAVFLLYGQLIGYCFAVAMGVVEEKSTRVVEVLLAAVRPVQLLAGKVIGIGLVGLLQLAVIGVIGLVAAVASNTITLPPDAAGTIGSVLLWFLLGYAFYSSLFAVAGAIVSRQEELQNTATPPEPARFRVVLHRLLELGRRRGHDPGQGVVLPATGRAPGHAAARRRRGRGRLGGGHLAGHHAGLDRDRGRPGRPPLRGRHPPHRCPGQAPRRLARRPPPAGPGYAGVTPSGKSGMISGSSCCRSAWSWSGGNGSSE